MKGCSIKKHRVILVFFMLITTCRLTAQDLHFSQFFETPLLTNPGLAGLFSGDVRLQAVYRTQWQSVTVPYQTGSLNGEYKVPVGGNDFMTIGGQILYDKAGSVGLTATQVLPAVNFHKSLNSDKSMYLSLGFIAGLVSRGIDESKITTNNQYNGSAYDPTAPTGETFAKSNYTYFDGSAGLVFNDQIGDNEDNSFYAGIAYDHFNNPKSISFYADPLDQMIPKWVFTGGLRLSTTEYSYMTYYFNYSKQGPYTEVIFGGLYTWRLDAVDDPQQLFHAGVLLRVQDAIIPVAKIELKPLTVSVSYDINLSKLVVASQDRGGMELGLTYQAYLDRDNSSKNAVVCPRF
jgi:type IX secretion system PorP/SprF family membrane protein